VGQIIFVYLCVNQSEKEMQVRIIFPFLSIEEYNAALDIYRKKWGNIIMSDEAGPSIFYDIDLDTMPREGDRIETIKGQCIVIHSCIYGLPFNNDPQYIYNANYIEVREE